MNKIRKALGRFAYMVEMFPHMYLKQDECTVLCTIFSTAVAPLWAVLDWGRNR